MNDEQRSGVGFFRGLLAVLRGVAHAVGTLLEAKGIREGHLFYDKFHAAL